MSLNEILKTLKHLIPEAEDEALLENLALQSSYIVFDNDGESLFKVGDAPKGFYFILSGEAVELVSKDVQIVIGQGSMVGLEEFIESRVHISHWRSIGRTETLFIDSRSFESFGKLGVGKTRVRQELASQLLRLKEACQANPSILIRPA